MIFAWLRPNRDNTDAEALYAAIVAEARQPHFYTALGVADTMDGRFDMILLHLVLVVRRLLAETGVEAGEARALAQALADRLGADIDGVLRELGTGDTKVPKLAKKMASAYRGRFEAYDDALTARDRVSLAEAIARNVMRAERPDAAAEALAAHAEAAADRLLATEFAALKAGRLAWPPQPVLGSAAP